MNVFSNLLQTFLLIVLINTTVVAQQLSNEGLENWDSSGFTEEVPIDWLVAQSYFSLPCNPVIFTTDKTNDAHSGNWAAKLETKFCEEDGGTPKAYSGLLACGDYTSYPNLPYGATFSERPAYLNFYCKFSKVGSDTGYASIRLITIDSTGNLDQVIAEGSIDIINNITSYTLFSVSLNYYSIIYPNVIQVLFSTSKTLAVANMLAATPPGNGASLGTTLWIDDVFLSGGSLGFPLFKEKHINFIPNPMEDFTVMHFVTPPKGWIVFKLYNAQGLLLKSLSYLNPTEIRFEKGKLLHGIYFYQIINNNESAVITGKISIK